MQHTLPLKIVFRWIFPPNYNQESQAALMNSVIWLLWLCSRARLYSDSFFFLILFFFTMTVVVFATTIALGRVTNVRGRV